MFRSLRSLSQVTLIPPLWGWAGSSALLLVVERLLVAGLAYEATLGDSRRAMVVGGALTVLFGARGAVRGVLRVGVQTRLHELAGATLLDGDVLRGSPLEAKDAFAAIVEGAAAGSRSMTDTLPDLAADAIAAALLGTFAMLTQPPGVLAVFGVALAFAALGVVLARRVTARSAERAWSAYTPVEEDLLALLGGRIELVANGRAAGFREESAARLRVWRAVALRSEALAALGGRAPVLAGAFGVVVALTLYAPLGALPFRDYLADAAVLAAIVAPFLGLARAGHELTRSAPQLRPLLELLAAPRLPRGDAESAVPALPANVTLDAVTFAYPGGRAVLEGTSVAWRSGHVLVVAGPNGSGKSTLFRLLLGLARPAKGTLRVGATDLFSMTLDAWRSRIAYLPQRPFLSDRATVREAVHLLAPAATDAAIRAALDRVGVLAALAESSPDPLDARIGTLSVGQRQRVALARVLVVDAPILMLDEPDANLDAAGIRMVREIVRELAPTKMIAIVAHTDELIDLAGTLVRLERPR